MEKSKIHRNFNYSFLLHVFSKHTVLYCNLNRYADFILIFFPSIKTKKLILMNNVCHILQIDIGILFCSFSFLFFFLFFLYIYIYIYIYTHIYIYIYIIVLNYFMDTCIYNKKKIVVEYKIIPTIYFTWYYI